MCGEHESSYKYIQVGDTFMRVQRESSSPPANCVHTMARTAHAQRITEMEGDGGWCWAWVCCHMGQHIACLVTQRVARALAARAQVDDDYEHTLAEARAAQASAEQRAAARTAMLRRGGVEDSLVKMATEITLGTPQVLQSATPLGQIGRKPASKVCDVGEAPPLRSPPLPPTTPSPITSPRLDETSGATSPSPLLLATPVGGLVSSLGSLTLGAEADRLPCMVSVLSTEEKHEASGQQERVMGRAQVKGGEATEVAGSKAKGSEAGDGQVEGVFRDFGMWLKSRGGGSGEHM